MNHFTDKAGYNGIRAGKDWLFRAAQPPGDRPFGAYFTTLPPETRRLSTRLRIPKRKLEYVFCFVDVGDLVSLDGDRGDYIFYSKVDYAVEPARQQYKGERKSCPLAE